MYDDYPELPAFLRRDPAEAPKPGRYLDRDGRPKIKNPTGKKVMWLPREMGPVAKALLREEQRLKEARKAERLAALRESKR